MLTSLCCQKQTSNLNLIIFEQGGNLALSVVAIIGNLMHLHVNAPDTVKSSSFTLFSAKANGSTVAFTTTCILEALTS